MNIANKIALITGGASGLGLATAERLLAGGAGVAVIDRNEAANRDLAARYGEQVLTFNVDVTDDEACTAAVAQVVERFGTIHICVNAAGIGGYGPTLLPNGSPLPLAEFRRLLEVNTVGTFNLARLCAAAMAKNTPEGETGERGVIINVASVTGLEGGAGAIHYAASKSAVVGMTLPMCRDLSPFGIRVVTIAAGLFKTPLAESLPPEVYAHLEATVEFPKRGGQPKEFAALACHIVDNPYLNGEVIRLDGGTRCVPR